MLKISLDKHGNLKKIIGSVNQNKNILQWNGTVLKTCFSNNQ